MAYVNCPICNDQSYFNVTSYSGPYRCMKCHELFNVVIENSEVVSNQTAEQDTSVHKQIKD